MADRSINQPGSPRWNDSLSDRKYLARRLSPSLWHPDCLALGDLASTVAHFASQATGQLFDYGCGGAPYRDFFSHCSGYVGADIVDGPEVDKMLNIDGSTTEDDSSYDTILSSQVLEHVAEPARYLREARRILRPGGRLILTTHGMFPEHGCPHDYYRWTPIALSREAERAGFTIEQSVKISPGARGAAFLLHLAVDDFCSRKRNWLHYAIAVMRRIYRATLLPALNMLARIVEPQAWLPGDNPARTYIGVGIVARKDGNSADTDIS